jgi:hypothetical protein
MSWVAVAIGGAAAISAGGSYMSSSKASKAAAQNSANQNQYAADMQQEYIDQLNALIEGAGSDVWGTKPEHAPYNMVNLTDSQRDTIAGNQANLPAAIELASGTNESIWENDQNRLRTLTPGYDQSVANLSSEIGARLQGQTTLGDTWSNLIADRAEITSAIGTPGTQQAATAKDIGMTQQDLFNSGASMFSQWLATANESISPISHQMRPQQMMFSPQERLSADLTQAQLDQQSRQSAFNLAAAPDPEAAGEMALMVGALGTSAGAAVGPAPGMISGNSPAGSAMSAFGGIISGLGTSGAIGQMGNQATQPTPQSSGGIQYQQPQQPQQYNPYGYGYMSGFNWNQQVPYQYPQ